MALPQPLKQSAELLTELVQENEDEDVLVDTDTPSE